MRALTGSKNPNFYHLQNKYLSFVAINFQRRNTASLLLCCGSALILHGRSLCSLPLNMSCFCWWQHQSTKKKKKKQKKSLKQNLHMGDDRCEEDLFFFNRKIHYLIINYNLLIRILGIDICFSIGTVYYMFFY